MTDKNDGVGGSDEVTRTGNDNVVSLRPRKPNDFDVNVPPSKLPQSCADVIAEAGKHEFHCLVVVGTRADGEPYLNANDGVSLMELAWLSKVLDNSLQKLMNS